MGQVFFRGWQLRAAVILLILLSLGLLPGTAKAWQTDSHTLSSANTQITFTAPNCDPVTGTPVLFCKGGVSMAPAECNPPMIPCNAATSPTSCPTSTADSAAFPICVHFALLVAQSGTASACITFPEGAVFFANEVDIFVVQVNAAGEAVAVAADTSMTASTGTGTGTLQVCTVPFPAAAGTTFDVQLNPTFVDPFFPIGTGQIHATLTFASAMQARAQFEHGDDEFRGGGETDDGGSFEESGHRHQDGSSEGRTRFKNDQEHCSFKSTQVTLVQVTPTGIDPITGRRLGILHMEGQGLNYGQPVTFVLDSVDNGDSGMLSTYSLTTSDGCHGGGHVTKGNARYHHDD